jgi:alanine racemase
VSCCFRVERGNNTTPNHIFFSKGFIKFRIADHTPADTNFPDKILKMEKQNFTKSDFFSTWLEIDLNAIRENCRSCMEITGTPMMAVVKANAYGYGAVDVARIANEVGVDSFAVARVQEGLTLLENGIKKDILVFHAFSQEEIDAAVSNRLVLSLNGIEMLPKIECSSRKFQIPARIHIKVDTGMGRFGVFPEEIPSLAEAAMATGCIQIEGIYSHYANIDDDPDSPLNVIQKERFEKSLDLLRSINIYPAKIHCSNSAAALNTPSSRYNLVRIGCALLGVNPFYYEPFPSYLQRALVWKTRLVSVRKLPAGYGIGYGQHYHLAEDSWIGVIPVGYGDGFRRMHDNVVLIGGKKIPVVGSVCTDACMVLLPDYFPIGEEVILLGKQGSESIEVEDLAERWHTTRADVTTGITDRVDRIYL